MQIFQELLNTRVEDYLLFDPKNRPPDPLVPGSPMSIRWTGELIAPATGQYTFAFTSDDGCRLYLNGEKLIDSWRVRSEETDYVTVSLEEGKTYELKALVFQRMEERRLLNWLGKHLFLNICNI